VATRRRPFRGVANTVRRKTVWARSDTGVAHPLTATGTRALDLLSELEALIGVNWIPGITIGPIFGNIQVIMGAESVPTTGVNHRVGLGIMFTDDDATNVPDPESDAADWMFRTVLRTYVPVDMPANRSMPGTPEVITQMQVSIRSKRIQRNNHVSLTLIGQSSTIPLTHDPQIFASFNTLVTLP